MNDIMPLLVAIAWGLGGGVILLIVVRRVMRISYRDGYEDGSRHRRYRAPW